MDPRLANRQARLPLTASRAGRVGMAGPCPGSSGGAAPTPHQNSGFVDHFAAPRGLDDSATQDPICLSHLRALHKSVSGFLVDAWKRPVGGEGNLPLTVGHAGLPSAPPSVLADRGIFPLVVHHTWMNRP